MFGGSEVFEKHGARLGIDPSSELSRIARADCVVSQRQLL
jgi:hypothetical protein